MTLPFNARFPFIIKPVKPVSLPLSKPETVYFPLLYPVPVVAASYPGMFPELSFATVSVSIDIALKPRLRMRMGLSLRTLS